MAFMKSNLPVLLVASVFLSGVSFAQAKEEEKGSLSHLDGYNGITVSIAAGATAASNIYRHRKVVDAIEASETQTTTVLRGTGATLMNKPSENMVDLMLSGARHGDVVSIEYTPGTIDELNQAVFDLKQSELAWQARVKVLSAELHRLDRARTVARHQLAKLPLKEESRAARERAQSRLEAAEKEYAHVKKADLDAQARMHHARGLYAAEKLNFETSLRRAEQIAGKSADGAAIGNMKLSPNLVTTIVRQDFPVDDSTRQRLLFFVNRVTASKLPREAKAQIPHMRITRINMPDYKGALKLLKDARRGFIGVGLGAAVAVEEVTTGYLAEGMRMALEPSAQIESRNTRTAR